MYTRLFSQSRQQVSATQFESADLNSRFYRDMRTALLVCSHDESMSAAGIEAGDLLSAEISVNVADRDIVVVQMSNGTVVRRIIFEDGIAYIISDNGQQVKRKLSPGEADIIAVVTGVHKITRGR